MDHFLDEFIGKSYVLTTSFGRQLVQRNANSFHQSWDERNLWLDKGFGIALSQFSEAKSLTTIVEVRNAIVHGNNQLTDRQAKSLFKVLELKKRLSLDLQSELQGRVIVLKANAGQLAIEIAANFVVSLDEAVAKVLED
ncbi:HEPN domain-containing protein [Arthrobacter sp. StoSoilB5]|uniref:HEPN domain-containing protein n=1 Tax=Arthrobacter sp. StoSoilB5 TaxID=2830992 RepID=UPI001CC72512|nr:HEPN domain-containing protein [Arthrobacter sp. StoSoilB5]